MSSSTVAPSSHPAPVEYTPISEAVDDALTAILFTAFNSFTHSVGLPDELASLDMARGFVVHGRTSPATFHLMATRPSNDSGAEHYVHGVGEVLGMVYMDCGDEAWGIGPVAVSPSAQGRGVGRALMLRCLKEAKQKRVQSVRLVGTVANNAAFALYHSLGFRACEYMVDVHGHFPADRYSLLVDEMRADGISVRPMTRDDLVACDQLHVATTSFSRLAGITSSFDAQPSQQAQSNGQPHETGTAPTVSCHVAVDASGALVGYSTGGSFMDHQSAYRRDKCTLVHSRHTTAYPLAGR